MKLTLLTYDSTVAYNAGYAFSSKAVEMAQILTDLVNDFSKETGVNPKDIWWKEVDDSDWCRRMVIIYAKVPNDWKPTENTFIWDEYYTKDWYENSVRSFWDWVEGRGVTTDIIKYPAKTPHNLFRTIQK